MRIVFWVMSFLIYCVMSFNAFNGKCRTTPVVTFQELCYKKLPPLCTVMLHGDRSYLKASLTRGLLELQNRLIELYTGKFFLTHCLIPISYCAFFFMAQEICKPLAPKQLLLGPLLLRELEKFPCRNLDTRGLAYLTSMTSLFT